MYSNFASIHKFKVHSLRTESGAYLIHYNSDFCFSTNHSHLRAQGSGSASITGFLLGPRACLIFSTSSKSQSQKATSYFMAQLLPCIHWHWRYLNHLVHLIRFLLFSSSFSCLALDTSVLKLETCSSDRGQLFT